MKPAPFEYLAATSVAQAIEALAADDEAQVIAGGQSLVPLLALRLARPTTLVDINGVGWDHVSLERERHAGLPVLAIGALVRHRRLELDPVIAREAPLLADAARWIGHPAIRNRGTIGGSVAHGDPAAELPAALVALSASVVAEGVHGRREIGAADLFTGFFSTSREPDEVLVEVRVPLGGGREGGAFCEWAPRHGDFAEAGVGVTLTLGNDGECRSVGAATCGIGSAPIPLADALIAAGVVGATAMSDALLRAVAAEVTRVCAGAGDDKATLAGLLAARAVARAYRGATAGIDVAA
jgi:aerobic carbon-monoxide dehydrogenase medium subunit